MNTIINNPIIITATTLLLISIGIIIGMAISYAINMPEKPFEDA